MNQNITSPGAFVETIASIKPIPLLLTSKTVHREIVPLLFGNNTFCVIDMDAETNPVHKLNDLAINSLKSLEVQVDEGLVDLGGIITTINTKMSLTNLKLVFYHDDTFWQRTLAEYMVMPAPKPQVELQLFTSIWATDEGATESRNSLNLHKAAAVKRFAVMQYNNLPQCNTVTIAASVGAGMAYALITYLDANGRAVFDPLLNKENGVSTCLRLK